MFRFDSYLSFWQDLSSHQKLFGFSSADEPCRAGSLEGCCLTAATVRLRAAEWREKKTLIRTVIAARLADVQFGIALAELGRSTPTGASWYNRAAWVAIHPPRLTPLTLLCSPFATHPSRSVPLSILCPHPPLRLPGPGPAGSIKGLLHSTLPGFVCCTFFNCFFF